MSSLDALRWSSSVTGLFFLFAFGAVVGSFLNVLVYRLPRGMNVVTPPSACPSCGSRLTWRENFPIFGWIFLKGRCKYCKSHISPEYPIVEFTVGAMWAALFALWFMRPSLFELFGASQSQLNAIKPEWAAEGFAFMWPAFFLVLLLISALIAMTLIDAKTYTIPPILPWVVMGIALVVHPLHALWIQSAHPQVLASARDWTLPLPDWSWIGVALGGGVGLMLANILLAVGVIPRSFDDYEEWEKANQQPARDETSATDSEHESNAPASQDMNIRLLLIRTAFFTGPAVALMFLGFALGARIGKGVQGMMVGMAVGLLIGIPLRRLAPAGEDAASEEPIWVQYPFARREICKEMIFLAPVVALGVLGWFLGRSYGDPQGFAPTTGQIIWAAGTPKLWLGALAGSILGVMSAGGIVWFFRIAGTLGIGKEAMGQGDVHLMAAVGAVLGWVDPIIAFFIAPFFGITWAALSVLAKGIFQRHGSALPYGPHLAAATVLIIYARPLVDLVLEILFNTPIQGP